MFREGATHEEIGKALGIGKETAERYVAAMRSSGADLPMRRPPHPEEVSTRVGDMFEQGRSYGEIAGELGITRGAVAGIVDRLRKGGRTLPPKSQGQEAAWRKRAGARTQQEPQFGRASPSDVGPPPEPLFPRGTATEVDPMELFREQSREADRLAGAEALSRRGKAAVAGGLAGGAAAAAGGGPDTAHQSAIGDWFSSLFGPPMPKVTHHSAANNEYPSDEDAEFARRQDNWRATPAENYIYGNRMSVLGRASLPGRRPQTFTPTDADAFTTNQLMQAVDNPAFNQHMDMTLPQNAMHRAWLDNTFARAALASKRHALATLGFNPKQTMLDLVASPATHNIGIAGLNADKRRMSPRATEDEVLDPTTDKMYANPSIPASGSTIVHESIHNGLQKVLARHPELEAELRQKLPILMDPRARDDFSELATRHIMDTVMGNTEEGSGPEATRQVHAARWYAEHIPEFKKMLDKVTRAAEEMVGRKMGPH
jgi:transposase